MTDNETENLQRAINESGFPLQLGLASLTGGDWRVVLTEHAWLDPLSQSEKFIDLVLQGRGSSGPQRLVTECKRAKDTQWIFLREPSSSENKDARTHLRARMVARHSGVEAAIDEWVDAQYLPGSPIANFCVIRKGGQRSQELLEKTAAEITRATDALAHQEVLIQGGPVGLLGRDLARLYIPMIVTTATMFICDADYGSVDLATGEVNGATISPVPIVRFHKSLGTEIPQVARVVSIEQFADQNERSVLVVQASAFVDFLKRADISRTMPATLIEALLY